MKIEDERICCTVCIWFCIVVCEEKEGRELKEEMEVRGEGEIKKYTGGNN